jgi:hypothetical protein
MDWNGNGKNYPGTNSLTAVSLPRGRRDNPDGFILTADGLPQA